MADNRTGTSILHYRILRPIGSGGMGVVYEAEDTKLGRRVALKFLPPDLARDRAALERFVREARAASALNHPNICTIYAIEEGDGAPFIAMELLEGESLDRAAAKRALTWDALVDTGVQIADALDAAHRRGIIHRDIKPANIFLTTEGRAKVLDFGVAKMAMERVAQAETMGEATMEQALTGAGVALGTIAYMSPEQARGEELDARSDLFGLAAVLYEIATGCRAFDGRTSAVIFNKILETTPEPPRAINPTLPPKLEDVILRGLEKDRDLRYQSAADLRADLKRLKRDASSGRLSFVPPAPGAPSAPVSSGALIAAGVRRHKGLAGAAALLVVALLGAAGYGLYALTRSGATTAGEADAGDAMTLTRLTTTGDVRGCASISPDGKLVVYCDLAGMLKVRQVATGATVDLGETDGATTFSPDGNFIYVTSYDEQYPTGVLWAIPSFGGDARRVLTNLAGAVGVSPDGQRLAFVRWDTAARESAIMIADVRGGNERRVAAVSGDSRFEGYGVSWSADGALLAAAQASVAGGFGLRPVVVHVETGRIETPGTRTWPDFGRTVWLPGNSGILFTARENNSAPLQFWIVRYPDGHTRRITSDGRGFGNMSVSVTADGSMVVTVPWEIITNIWSTNADATAPLEQWTSGSRYDGYGMYQAPNGRIYYGSYSGSDMGIWSLETPGGRPRQLTPDFATELSLPHDGSFVVFQAVHDGRYRVWRMDADGSNARVITKGEDDARPFVSPDGRWVYYVRAGANQAIVRIAADGSGAPMVVNEQPVNFRGISPDGRSLLAAAVDPSLGGSHVILDAETGAITARLTLPADVEAGWGRRSDIIAYILNRNGISNLWEQPIAGGAPRQLTNFTSEQIFHFAYSADGTRLFLSRGRRTGDLWALRNFR